MSHPAFPACTWGSTSSSNTTGPRAGALREYYKYARDNDLFLTYVIVNPQANQSKAAHEQEDKYLAVGIVDQDAEGITVRGARDAGNQRHHGQRGDFAAASSPCARATRCTRFRSPCP
ncbi:4-hydroxyphenylacetate 3-hydroxylase N-terminal domain-containing protein [Cupriavidus basilensis]